MDAFASLPGAVLGTGPDDGVPAHYGQPLIEQRALAAGTALVDLSHRGVVTVTGPDRLTWLNNLTSQRLLDLGDGDSTETLVLTPTGHIEHALKVVELDGTCWILTERAHVPALVDWLDKMRFMLRVEVADRSNDFAVVGEASQSRDVEPPALFAWVDPWPRTADGSASYADVGDDEHPGFDYAWREIVIPAEHAADYVRARLGSGMTAAGTTASEALRIAAWRPRLDVDTDDRAHAAELDWLRTAVHLAKGCYRGQEAVARLHNLGMPPRRLVFLNLDGSGHTLPDPGAPVKNGEKTVGRITSAGWHYDLGPIALAVIKRNTAVDAALLVDGDDGPIDAAQETIVARDRERRVGLPPNRRELRR
ncbi:folate-binding protein YgfZ [Spelaeicoccus albus]|uniref:Aminomethyltransferase folate-binding domain-containing protein n=1 Tax=Spelaeicoccus albus TaxID=1280376 RepID=A0A7Z0A9E6_9MICO|nr:hypothetical protein [Spelaeicoccus albus]